jgi:hypothetical protein
VIALSREAGSFARRMPLGSVAMKAFAACSSDKLAWPARGSSGLSARPWVVDRVWTPAHGLGLSVVEAIGAAVTARRDR